MVKKILTKGICIAAVIFIGLSQISFTNQKASLNSQVAKSLLHATDSSKLMFYDSLQLGNLGLSRQAYEYALQGYRALLQNGKIKNAEILSIIDFSLPSTAKRLFVIDLKQGTMLFNTHVSHGRNSGIAMANEFSNSPESFKSSLGFYVTSDTYMGKHGYSMRLEGEEKGINDNAFDRGIVMHSAAYVNEKLIRSQGYIGRSLGCPAVSPQFYKPIINKIKNGSCLFMYSPVKDYTTKSVFIRDSTAA